MKKSTEHSVTLALNSAAALVITAFLSRTTSEEWAMRAVLVLYLFWNAIQASLALRDLGNAVLDEREAEQDRLAQESFDDMFFDKSETEEG